jgi:hypothetical protein
VFGDLAGVLRSQQLFLIAIEPCADIGLLGDSVMVYVWSSHEDGAVVLGRDYLELGADINRDSGAIAAPSARSW